MTVIAQIGAVRGAIWVWLFVVLFSLPAQAGKSLHYWALFKLDAYTSVQHNYYPDGDITPKKAFFWGRVMGADGVYFEIRGLLPHLVEGDWQEPVYHNPAERTYVFNKVKAFQDTYSGYGCSVNFLHTHGHHRLGGETVAQWRAAVLEGVRQEAELCAFAGVAGIFIDMEFSNTDSVSTDPDFWYQLGAEVVGTMQSEKPDIKLVIYPGLYNYWQTLSEAERTNPKAMGSYPGETSIPEARRNMRHALYQGIYDNRNGMEIWHHEGWTSRHVHLSYGTPQKTYLFDTHAIVTDLINGHTAMLGPDIVYRFERWDIGAANLPRPVPGKHWKQPFCHVNGSRRMAELIYDYTDYLGVWTDFGGYEDDNSHYMTYGSMSEFIGDLAGVGWSSPYVYDTITGEEHFIEVPAGASVSEKLSYFAIHAGPGGYHITGKLADNMTDYVDNLIVASGKSKVVIFLQDASEYGWAEEYKQKGFFKHHELIFTPGDPNHYGRLEPVVICGDADFVYDAGDLDRNCSVDVFDFVEIAQQWLQCSDPGDPFCAQAARPSIIVGYELNESGDLGQGNHSLFNHGSTWDASDHAPGTYSSQSLRCAPPGDANGDRFVAVVGPVEDGGNQMSWICWLKLDSAIWEPSRYTYAYGGAAGAYGDQPGEFQLDLADTSRLIRFRLVDEYGSQLVVYPDPIDLDRWYHVAVVFDHGDWTLYLDGLPSANTVTSGTVPELPGREIFIGASPYVANQWLGNIDEFAIFGGALSPEQIQAIMDYGLQAAAPEVCGDAGTSYLKVDVNRDCRVDIRDLAIVISEWLE